MFPRGSATYGRICLSRVSIMSIHRAKVSKEKHNFIDRFGRDPRRLQRRLFLSDADESCNVKQGHNLWFPQIPRQCFLYLI